MKIYGSHVSAICADASDEAGISKIAEELSQKHKSLDGMVCCLGSGKPMEDDKLSPREWQRLMQINLYSAEALVKSLLPLSKSIVNRIYIIYCREGVQWRAIRICCGEGRNIDACQIFVA